MAGALAAGLSGLQTTVATEGDDRAAVATACQAPRAELWLVAGGGGSTRRERVVLTNPGANTVSADVTVLGSSGTLPSANGQNVAIPPRGRTSLLVDALVGPESTPVVHVVASGGVITGVVEDSWIDGATGRGADDAAPAAEPSNEQVVPAAYLDGPARLRVAVPGTEETVVQARALTKDGPGRAVRRRGAAGSRRHRPRARPLLGRGRRLRHPGPGRPSRRRRRDGRTPSQGRRPVRLRVDHVDRPDRVGGRHATARRRDGVGDARRDRRHARPRRSTSSPSPAPWTSGPSRWAPTASRPSTSPARDRSGYARPRARSARASRSAWLRPTPTRCSPSFRSRRPSCRRPRYPSAKSRADPSPRGCGGGRSRVLTGMAEDEELPDFPDEPKQDRDTQVPTAPAGPDDPEEDVDHPMNSA